MNSCMSVLPSLSSAPEIPDPVLREVSLEGGAADGEAADHVADEGIALPVPQHRLGLTAQLRRQFARAAARPAMVRSLMRSRSIWASVPLAVVVSIPSVCERKPNPLSSSS